MEIDESSPVTVEDSKYDGDGRVAKVTAPGRTTVYSYDRANNRVYMKETYVSSRPSGFVDEGTGDGIEYIVMKSLI